MTKSAPRAHTGMAHADAAWPGGPGRSSPFAASPGPATNVPNRTLALKRYRATLAAAYSWASVEPGRGSAILRRVQRCEPLYGLPTDLGAWKRGEDGTARAEAWLQSRVEAHDLPAGLEPDLAVLAALANDWIEGHRIALLYTPRHDPAGAT